ncbi:MULTISPECIES: ATP-dependent Clp protease ATP-binding subunit [Blautia]|uniref:ATP-dependent Clp protease ATP-binding subunit n=1 Tax=Blautia TaxID=572511 RepID=UPI000BA2EAF7|nr:MULTISPECIES: ATP-dependent Clp protease ATP-binding subunit [Blautia]
MKERYSKQAVSALKAAEKTAEGRSHNYVGTEHLLAGLLKETSGTAGLVLAEAGVEEKKLLALIDKLIAPQGDVVLENPQGYTPRAQRVLDKAREESGNLGGGVIGTEHILIAMLKEYDCVGTRLLHTLGINIQQLYLDVLKAMGKDKMIPKEDLQSGNLMKASTGSQTPTLDQYSRDLTKMAADGKLDPVIGREKEISRIIQILSRRSKNNPCLIGEPGVGKTAITEGLAQRIVWGLVPENMLDKRVVVLDLSGMVAGSKYRGEFEERIKKVVQEVMNNKGILLFIDELHTIIGAGGAEGALDASNILKPSLSRGEIQLIGATTIDEYRKYIEKDAALERRFQPVMVEEPSKEEAVEILKGLAPYYEKHHGAVIEESAIEAAVTMGIRYINDRFLPDKAIDLLDEAASKVQLAGYKTPEGIVQTENHLRRIYAAKEEAVKSQDFDLAKELQAEQEKAEGELTKARERYEKQCRSKKLVVKAEDIAEVVSEWTKIPVKKLAEGESKRLARLEQILHKRVVGQEEAVSAVAKAVKRGRVGLKDPKRPIGSFLLLGPTGVGKTELSKALAEAVFGSEQSMIRVDMSEYMEKHSVSKLIGSPPGYVGYEEGGQFSEKVRRNPYSVILFDEIEKAHPDVFNILLQVLDDGHITDAQGRKVDFKETIIIMTSNAGAQAIIAPKKLGFGAVEDEKQDYKRMKEGVMEEVKRMFKPEFLNRIDEIIVFHTLNKEEIKKIVGILMKDLIKRCKDQMNINLKVRDSVKELIAKEGFDPKYGARPLKRAIQSKIEDAMAEEILEGKIKEGDEVTLGISKQGIKFVVNPSND